jgi:hypothetical protein
MNSRKLITTRIATFETYYCDLKTYVGNTIINLNSRITSMQNQITGMNISDYNNVKYDLNDAIINIHEQIDAIIIPDCMSESNYLIDSIAGLEEYINEMTVPDYTYPIGFINDTQTNLQVLVNGIVFISDFKSQINSLNSKMITVGEAIATLDNTNTSVHVEIMCDINNLQE